MASLNVCSMTFGDNEFLNPPQKVRELASRMRELGVKPELEIYDTGHLDVALALREEGLLEDPLQFSIVMGVSGGIAPTPANLVMLADRMPPGAVWQAIGIGRANRAVTAIALAMGANARTGMEDTLMLRRGVPASGNAELVRSLVDVVRALDRSVATVDEVERTLALPPRPSA